MIFASQDPESQAFVVFLTVIVAIINVGMLVWLVVQMVREYMHEQKEAAAENDDGAGSSFSEIISNARDSLQRWRFNRMTPEAQQRAIRRRTFDAADGNTAENPVTIEMTGITIEMTDIYAAGESTGEIKVDDENVDSTTRKDGGLMYENENPARRDNNGKNKKLQQYGL